jgi:hypothetical protein
MILFDKREGQVEKKEVLHPDSCRGEQLRNFTKFLKLSKVC